MEPASSLQPRIAAFAAPSPNGTNTIAYADWGNASAPRAVVCCHGLTRNGRDFDFLAGR